MNANGEAENASSPAVRPSSPRKRKAYRLRKAMQLAGLEANLAIRRFGCDRMRPDVFVVGVQKSGTTSLFGHLAQHPEVLPPLVKEVHYFDVSLNRGDAWYACHFPEVRAASARAQDIGSPVLTFDASPYYIFHPDVASRIRRYSPDARIIAVLRDPVARAWSHYWHEWARGYEKLSPMPAFLAESHRIPDPHVSVGNTAPARYAHQHFSYVARSEYDLQLARWRDIFPPDQVLCLKSEALFEDPATSLGKVARFLQISDFAPGTARILNSGRYDVPPPDVAAWLRDRLAASMAATRTMLGDEFSWD